MVQRRAFVPARTSQNDELLPRWLCPETREMQRAPIVYLKRHYKDIAAILNKLVEERGINEATGAVIDAFCARFADQENFDEDKFREAVMDGIDGD